MTSTLEVATRQKENVNADKKRIICRQAAQIIHEGDCIYIDGGTTTLFLIEKIANMDVTIITTNTLFLEKLPSTFRNHLFDRRRIRIEKRYGVRSARHSNA